MDLLLETDEIEQDVAIEPPVSTAFDEGKYKQLKKKGFHFEL